VASDPTLAETAAELAETAGDYLRSGRRDIAELYAQAAVATDASAFEAWLLLAGLALEARRPDRAQAWLQRALQLRPQDARAAELLQRSAREAPAAASPRPRYLLVREWSAGFWSDVDHVLGMCLLAELSGRIPFVWWGEQSRFRAAGVANAWEHFFAPVSDAALGDLEGPGLRIFPDKWRGRPLASRIPNRWSGDGSRLVGLQFLGRDEEVAVSDFHTGVNVLRAWLPADHPVAGKSVPETYRYLIAKYLRPRAEIVAEAGRFAQAHFGAAPVVGVHVRASDKVQEVSALEALSAEYFPVVERWLAASPDAKLFLLTDDARVTTLYEKRYGARLVTTACTRTASTVPVHFMQHADPGRIGVAVMVDAYLAARCSQFIGLGYSNVSLFVSYLKRWPPGSCVLLGENAHEIWNALALEMPPPPDAA